MRRLIVSTLAATLATVGLAACSTGYKDLPLPGSDVGGDTYEVTAVFDQALNLAQGAQVKVNGVSVGRVQDVKAKDFQAIVSMDIKESVEIPDDSTVRLRYDTPLGELIVQVTPGKSGRDLGDGDAFAERRTTTAPSVEDALASASMLINGGRLGELQTIAEELNTTFGGREEEIRASLERVTSFLHEANASSDDIGRALEALRSVSSVLAERRGTIRKALDQVGPAVETLGKDTDKIVALLTSVEGLARTAKRIALQVDDPLLTILQQIGPIADQVLATKSKLRAGLDDLVAVADQLSRTVPSDTLPLRALLHLDETQLNILGGDPRAQVDEGAAADAVRRGDLYLPGLGLLLGANDVEGRR
ncbi:MCE family protein [Nocardioides humilatus]|uniref:MCE family protein n=1 Tax=Nocardioides humilatus TaxID=2607660 RepID=A0A5B1LG36_9ACTN|nr:MCE family protein [Nocardioides humilatus]KAA1419314.1 MCE family protein [Nocardioides humilatus]